MLLQANEAPVSAEEGDPPASEETVLSAVEPEPAAESERAPEATKESETNSEDSL